MSGNPGLARPRLRIDIPRTAAAEEFYRRCAQAWIIWSPEGHGWDCFRHYEALACGSVPLINQPTIERYRPLLDGVHALYYDPEPGRADARARNGARRQGPAATIARNGRAQCMRHHTHDGDRRHIDETRSAAIQRTR